MTVKVVESAAREALRAPRFAGVRARTPPWKLGVSQPAASRVTAKLLRGSTRSDLVEWPARSESLRDLLVTNGWSRIWSLLEPASFRIVLSRESGQARTRLTPRQFEVSSFVARGYKSRHAGAALSIAAATARGATERALGKLGLASTAQLVLLWRTLSGPPEHFGEIEGAEWVRYRTDFASLRFERLTEGQRQLVLGLMSGERIADIAQRRAVSPRTISNQLGSLFRRFAASSRAELILQLLTPVAGGP